MADHDKVTIMPNKRTVLRVDANDQMLLAEQIAALHLSQQATQSQVATIIAALRPLLPCAVRVDMRTPKGVAYVQASGKKLDAFMVSPRAKLTRIFDDLD